MCIPWLRRSTGCATVSCVLMRNQRHAAETRRRQKEFLGQLSLLENR